MNLKDLNKIDIKDLRKIDMSQISAYVQSQPDLLINILMVIVTVAVAFSSFKGFKQSKRQLEYETSELQKKLAAMEKFEVVDKQRENFLKNIPKAITGDELIQTLSEFAFQRNVQILSFSPAQKQRNDYLQITSVVVNVSSDEYANIILFIHDIEQSSYPIRVQNWSGTSLRTSESLGPRAQRLNRQANNTQDEIDYIKATITIESVEPQNV